jgi:UDP-N-acetylglucosamine 2-epimerase (non-hydrolysing)
VTLRENTERPETVYAEANVIAGYRSDAILASAKKMLSAGGKWQNPFGDGTAGRKIIDISMGHLKT